MNEWRETWKVMFGWFLDLRAMQIILTWVDLKFVSWLPVTSKEAEKFNQAVCTERIKKEFSMHACIQCLSVCNCLNPGI